MLNVPIDNLRVILEIYFSKQSTALLLIIKHAITCTQNFHSNKIVLSKTAKTYKKAKTKPMVNYKNCSYVHRESKKTRHQTLSHNFANYYPIFNFFFTCRLSSKFATNSCLNIPPRFKHVATLPYEI